MIGAAGCHAPFTGAGAGPDSIVSGGLACVVGALVLNGLLPGFRHDGRGPQAADDPSPGSSSRIGVESDGDGI